MAGSIVSDIELWNEVAITQGATPARKVDAAKAIKGKLAAIVDRRNKIAHEGDFGPSIPRMLNTVAASDLADLRLAITFIVEGITAVI